MTSRAMPRISTTNGTDVVLLQESYDIEGDRPKRLVKLKDVFLRGDLSWLGAFGSIGVLSWGTSFGIILKCPMPN